MNYMTADEAVRLVRSGDTVCCQGSTSVPVILQEALTRRADELRDGIRRIFGRKGEEIVASNINAFDAGFASARK